MKMDLATDSKDQGVGQPVILPQVSDDNIMALATHVTQDDLVKLKFLCLDWIDGASWQRIETFSHLVARLKRELKSTDTFRDVLVELFFTIQRYDLLKVLGSCKHTAATQERKLVPRYWKDWYERVEEIELDNNESVDKLLPPLQRLRTKDLEEICLPLHELLSEQGSVLKKLWQRIEVPGDAYREYPIKPVGTYGLCIIINNEKFPPPKERKGTDKDKEKLVRLFESFDFTVEARDDLKASEMKEWIMEVAKRNHRQLDCFVCWILTHGSEGCVQGVNTNDADCTLNIQQDIIQPFCMTAETLVDKPKLFFINACQGTAKQGVAGIPRKKEPEENLQSDSYVPVQTLPKISDYLLAMPTIPGYESYRSTSKGTWFVMAFADEFENYGAKEDVLSVLTLVHAKVARAAGKIKESDSDNAEKIDCKQIPETTHSLRKKLYLRKKRQPEECE